MVDCEDAFVIWVVTCGFRFSSEVSNSRIFLYLVSINTLLLFSNNNNSIDASTFHADIYNFDDNYNIIPLFTCVTYFDKSFGLL